MTTDAAPEARTKTALIEDLGEVTDRLVAQAVDVYVIGYRFSESQDVLNAIAARGNTRFERYIPAGSEESHQRISVDCNGPKGLPVGSLSLGHQRFIANGHCAH